MPKNEANTFHADRIIAEAKKCDAQIIALSHVQYSTGYLIDIKKIGAFCSQNNILFIVDGTQALGCVPINLEELDVDVYAASTYKWLCAGHGCGIMYVSQSCQQKLKFMTGGYMAWFETGDNWRTQQSLTNLEAGHKDHEAFYRLGLALDDVLAKDLDEVLNHNRNLISKMNLFFKENNIEVISDYSPEELAGITVIKADEELFKLLKDHKVYCTYRKGTIRLSCHFYNDENDLLTLGRLFHERQ